MVRQGARAPVGEPAGDDGTAGRAATVAAPGAHDRRERVRRACIVAALGVLACVLAMVVAKQLFPYLSRNPDETAYVMQSRMVRDGEISLPAATHEEFFRPALSGPRDGKVVFLYTPEWGAVLAASSLVFGTTIVAVGLTAGATVVVVYLFASELFESRVALLAAAIFALSPLFVVQSGTRLSYEFGVLTDVAFGWLLLRGLRTESRWSFAASGAAFGAAFFGRPYDAVLFAVPFLIFVLVTRRTRLRALGASLGWFVAGVAPFLVVAGIVNQDLMGNPFSFPQNVAGRLNSFGFGERLGFQAPHGKRFVPVHFGVGEAFLTMWRNVIELRAWIFGGILAIAVGVFGLFRSKPRAREWLLLGLLVAFPLGYIFWYGIYTATTTFHGIYSYGPYYYYPAFVALVLLVARGIVGLLAGRPRAVVWGAAAVLLAITAVAMRTPVNDANKNAKEQRRALALFASVPKHNALVVLPQFWLGSPYPTLTNDPHLKNPVLYALDHGDQNLVLLDRFPDRRAFVASFRFAAGADIFRTVPRRVLEETSVVRKTSFTVSIHVRNPDDQRYVIVYAEEGGRVVQRVLDTRSRRGASYDTEMTVVAPGAGTAPTGQLALGPTPHGHFAVGVAFSSTPDPARGERFEYRYSFGAAPSGDAEIVTSPQQWHRLVFLNGKAAWVSEDVTPVVSTR